MLSIVIPAYNNLESVRRLCCSIYRQFDTSRGEVIVVDDGSDKCDMACLKKEFGAIRVVRLAANGGAANARNIGVAHASYDTIIFLDSDMELCGGAIDEFIRIMTDPSVDAVVGTVTDVPLNRGIFQDYWALLKSYFHSFPKDFSSTFYPMLGAVRKSVLMDVGGFDGRIKGASIEDYELSNRLIQKGYKVRFNPAICASTSYKKFFESLKQSMERSKKWGIMFLGKGRFDNHTTTALQGAANLLGFAFWIFFVLAFIHKIFAIPAAIAVLLTAMLIRGFLAYVLQRRGIAFFAVSFLMYLVSSIAITLGFLSGALYVFRSKKSREAALYG